MKVAKMRMVSSLLTSNCDRNTLNTVKLLCRDHLANGCVLLFGAAKAGQISAFFHLVETRLPELVSVFITVQIGRYAGQPKNTPELAMRLSIAESYPIWTKPGQTKFDATGLKYGSQLIFSANGRLQRSRNQ
jgi:hypothetical protein